MSKPRVFVSSTYYDLKHLRSSLENFIDLLGFEPVLSEKGDIAYMPDSPLDESCYRETRNSDIYVLIIGGRYGSQASEGIKALKQDFFDRYDSITKLEYKNAVERDIPIFILIDKSVYADYENFLRNRDQRNFTYAHVDSVNIFHLIEDILSQTRNNPIFQFDRYSDIEAWLKEQWAGLFRELLRRMSEQQQISTLSSRIAELSEINQTLKKYLEAVMSQANPEGSRELIKSESERLAAAQQRSILSMNPLARHISPSAIATDEILEAFHKYSTLEEFVAHLKTLTTDERSLARLTNLLTTHRNPAMRDFAQMRNALGYHTPNATYKESKLDTQESLELNAL